MRRRSIMLKPVQRKLQLCAAEQEEVARPVALYNESGEWCVFPLTTNRTPRGGDGR
jgi:hypothetical protein